MRARTVAGIAGLISTIVVMGCHRFESTRIEVEVQSPAVSKQRLVEDIGIETLGGVFTPLLKRGRDIPAVDVEVFSTAADGQTQIEIRPFRGLSSKASENTELGSFVIGSLPAAPRGTVVVDVTFRVEAQTIVLEARERTGTRVTLTRLSSRGDS